MQEYIKGTLGAGLVPVLAVFIVPREYAGDTISHLVQRIVSPYPDGENRSFVTRIGVFCTNIWATDASVKKHC